MYDTSDMFYGCFNLRTIPEDIADIIIENILFDYNEKQIKKMTYDDIAEYIIEYFKSVLLDDITKYTQDKLLDIVTDNRGDNKCH